MRYTMVEVAVPNDCALNSLGVLYRFAREVRSYFSRWVDALSGALIRSKRSSASARALAEEVVAGIQGAIVLARAFNDPQAFARALARMRNRVANR